MGLEIDYFYKLTPRQFDNISNGYFKKKETELKRDLIMNRELKFAILMPHLTDKTATAKKLFPLSWEVDEEEVDLKAEIAAVKKNKRVWKKLDKK